MVFRGFCQIVEKQNLTSIHVAFILQFDKQALSASFPLLWELINFLFVNYGLIKMLMAAHANLAFSFVSIR